MSKRFVTTFSVNDGHVVVRQSYVGEDPTRVIINDPATIVFFGNEKYVSKCVGDDEFNPLFGIMNCCLRSVGNNKIRVKAWEYVTDFLATNLADAEECRVISEVLSKTADALDLDGVMEQMEQYDARVEHDGASEGPSACVTKDDGQLPMKDQDAMRQEIRRLVDAGEI